MAIKVDGTAGTAPMTPTLAYGTHTIEFDPAGNPAPTPYVVTVTQNGAVASRTIYYNSSADTFGKVANGLATSSIRSHTASVGAFSHPSIVRRDILGTANRPLYADGKFVVRYDPEQMGSRTFVSVEAAHGIIHAQTFGQSPRLVTRVLNVAPGTNVEAAVRSMQSEQGVVAAYRVGLRYPAAPNPAAIYPGNVYFYASGNQQNGNQWYQYLVNAPAAWAYTKGTAPIAVIDTGYDSAQPDVAGNVKTSVKIINLMVYPSGAGNDSDGHGTYLSGLASAVTSLTASTPGFAGMGFNAPLLEYKIFSDGAAASISAQTTDEAAAIYDAVNSHGAKVILLGVQGPPTASGGNGGPDPDEQQAVEYAIQKGVTVVAASGDDGGTSLDYPAGYNGVISVGASAINDSGVPGVVNGVGNGEFVPSYSNYGTGLGLTAPGGWGPQSTNDQDLIHFVENAYTTQPYAGNPKCTASGADCAVLWYGTSPAAATVAGTAALMLTANSALTPAQVASILYSTTDDIKDARQGHGRLNAGRALAVTTGDTSPALPPALPRAIQLVAFAYTNSGATLPVAPAIIDVNYPAGVPVNADGTFRLGDVLLPTGKTNFKVGVWFNTHGDGMIHAGDYFIASGNCGKTSCTGQVGNMTMAQLATTATTLP
jgi:hypothetical protein